MPETDLTLWALAPYRPPVESPTEDADNTDREALEALAALYREDRIA